MRQTQIIDLREVRERSAFRGFVRVAPTFLHPRQRERFASGRDAPPSRAEITTSARVKGLILRSGWECHGIVRPVSEERCTRMCKLRRPRQPDDLLPMPHGLVLLSEVSEGEKSVIFRQCGRQYRYCLSQATPSFGRLTGPFTRRGATRMTLPTLSRRRSRSSRGGCGSTRRWQC